MPDPQIGKTVIYRGPETDQAAIITGIVTDDNDNVAGVNLLTAQGGVWVVQNYVEYSTDSYNSYREIGEPFNDGSETNDTTNTGTTSQTGTPNTTDQTGSLPEDGNGDPAVQSGTNTGLQPNNADNTGTNDIAPNTTDAATEDGATDTTNNDTTNNPDNSVTGE